MDGGESPYRKIVKLLNRVRISYTFATDRFNRSYVAIWKSIKQKEQTFLHIQHYWRSVGVADYGHSWMDIFKL